MPMLKIKNLKINSHSLLLPMAGFTDLPFRLICRKYGCKFAFTEMVDATAIKYNNPQTLGMLESNRHDRPLGVQLVGGNEYDMLFAAQMLEQKGFSWIDINAACPVKKVVKKRAGSFLIKEPKYLEKILNLLTRNLKLPLSVKIRSGFNENSINAVEVAKLIENCGANAVIIHGRHREQGYRGQVDYKIITEVKKSVKIPVVASGDILSAELAKKMFDETGCDAVGVARGALGNPWIFKEIDTFLKNGKPLKMPSQGEILKTLFNHIVQSINLHGEFRSMAKMRKVLTSYVKNFDGAKKLRVEINQANTLEELKSILKNYS